MRTSRWILLWFGWLSWLPAIQAQLTFTTNNGAITITGCTGTAGVLNIPAATNGYPVASIGNNAFQNNSSLTNISIPGSVTNIGSWAFASCNHLTNATIGTGLISVGDFAFVNDSLLTTVTLPDSVGTIGAVTFEGCYGLTNFAFGNNVTNIGEQAFADCENLTAFTVASGNSTYSSLGGLLTDKGQTTIIQYPCGKAGNYVLLNSVTNIADNAFSFCSGLTGILIGDGVRRIGVSAFINSPNLTNVVIGTNVTSIGSGAFDSDSSLISFVVSTTNSAYSSLGGVLFNKNQTTLIQFPEAKAGNYTTPGTVTNIGDNAFSDCPNLINATLGDSVISIGSGAFFGCINLANVNIGSGLTSIGYDGFDECYSLITITVNPLNPVYSSVNGVLYNKNQTTLVRCPAGIAGNYSVPASVTSIGELAFVNDYQLTSVYFAGNAPSIPTDGSLVFDDPVTAYFLPGTAGWGTNFGGMPAVSWNPQMRTLSVQGKQFGFAITGNTNLVVVVAACTNLANPNWQPIQTNTLTTGTANFRDPQFANYPRRFYRLRSP